MSHATMVSHVQRQRAAGLLATANDPGTAGPLIPRGKLTPPVMTPRQAVRYYRHRLAALEWMNNRRLRVLLAEAYKWIGELENAGAKPTTSQPR